MQNHEQFEATSTARGEAQRQAQAQTPAVHEETTQVDSGDGELQFLPVNQVLTTAEATRQRAYLSCDACRQRKTRCIPNTAGQRHPCRRCVADDKPCQFRNSRAVGTRRSTRHPDPGRPLRRRTGLSRSSSVSSRAADQELQHATTIHVTTDGSMSTSSELAPALASAPASGVDVEPSIPSIIEDLGSDMGFFAPPFESPGDGDPDHSAPSLDAISPYATRAAKAISHSQPSARSRIITTRLHDTADALDLLTLAAAEVQNQNQNHNQNQNQNHTKDPEARGGSSSNHHPFASPQHTVTNNTAGGETWPRPTSQTDWNKFLLIKKGVTTELEVVEYLDFYFSTLWPLRPMVHSFYRDRARYGLLAAEEPLLLTCLVTLASRYHSLSGAHGEVRSERIHWQAWRFLQKYIQSALWGSPVTRSLGAIVAMLLLIEWHSKSINNPLGLSDGDDYELFNVPESESGYRYDENDPSSLSSSENRQRFGMSTLLEKLNIVAPAYRSNKMSWMLLSNAIALAQESGCGEEAPRESRGAFSSYQTFKHEWSQLICVFLYLADESLSLRLGLETLSPDKLTHAVRTRLSSSFASLLPNSVLWESYYELTLEARRARELLQSLKRAGPAVAASAILPDLEHIERGLCRWKRQHAYTVTDDASLLHACVDLEYQYLVMYSFAPASDMMFNDMDQPSGRPARNRTPDALFKLADRATSASREMLNTLVNVLEPSSMLKYVPVRCWLFLVAANLHLLKMTLTAEIATIESDEDLRLLKASIVAIRNGAPDDTHMANRYARFLDIMLNSSYHLSHADSQSPGRTGQGQELSAAMRSGGFGQPDVGAARTFMSSSMNDFGPADIANGLGNIGDLVDWSDGSFGILGAIGLLPNMTKK